MNRVITAFSLASLAALPACDMRAQSANSGAGWSALMSTPIGALTPIGPAPANDTVWHRVQLRYGHWSFGRDENNTNNFALGVAFHGASTRTAIEFGYGYDARSQNSDYIMLGVDVDVPIIEPRESETGLRVALNPAAGYGDGGGTALSAALSLPVSVAYSVGGMSVIPFISPGIGYGLVFAGGESAGATRTLLAAGISAARDGSTLRLTISARKIFIEGAPTVYGIGLSIGG